MSRLCLDTVLPACTSAADVVAPALDEIAARLGDWPETLTAIQAISLLCAGGCGGTARATARAHPIAALLRQDPFTDWAMRRPRGYPGDATLMDFVYGHPSVAGILESATPVGRAINACVVGGARCVAMREARLIMARAIDAAVTRVGRPDILAVGAGHMRELDLASAAAAARRIVALDQDADSLREAEACHGALGNLHVVPARIARLIARPQYLGWFDLIHAAGLYDYLDAGVAAQLTAALFQALRPGGRLLICCAGEESPDDGYREVFMNWPLVHRGAAEVAALAAELPGALLARRAVFHGSNGAAVYLLVERAAA
jgi:SAM-dependent methyltransferase